jgi:hypothetical protein
VATSFLKFPPEKLTPELLEGVSDGGKGGSASEEAPYNPASRSGRAEFRLWSNKWWYVANGECLQKQNN